MKAIVCDGSILRNIEPLTLEAYLHTKGWHERNRIPKRVSIWTRDTFAKDRLKVQVPLDMEFDDYPHRMYEIMEILEKAENRSQLDIIGELITKVANISLQGIVIEIGSQQEQAGEVTLFGVVVDKLRKIKTYLKEPDYSLAVKAYQERLLVVCQGDLLKEGENFTLKNTCKFNLGG